MKEGFIRFELSLDQFSQNNAPEGSILFLRSMINGPSEHEYYFHYKLLNKSFKLFPDTYFDSEEFDLITQQIESVIGLPLNDLERGDERQGIFVNTPTRQEIANQVKRIHALSRYERNVVTVDYKMMTMQEIADAGLPFEKIRGMDGLYSVIRR